MERMIALHNQLARGDGYTQTLVDDVRLTRSTQSATKSPAMYDPCIAIALQGHKQTYFGNDILQFDADHYLVVAVPIPFTANTMASPEHPFLGISIRRRIVELNARIAQLKREEAAGPVNPYQAMYEMMPGTDEAKQPNPLLLKAMGKSTPTNGHAPIDSGNGESNIGRQQEDNDG